MRKCTVVAWFCVALAGCAGAEGGGDNKDLVPIFDVVLKHEFAGPKAPDVLYLFVDGKDPEAKQLEKLQKTWPMLQPGSKVPQKGLATRISISDLKWTGRDAVDLQGGVSNGMDGRVKHFWLKRKNGTWSVEKAEITAIS
jgi:hypothetical protein